MFIHANAPRPAHAIITPSHAPDFARCCVLVESVRRHAAPGIDHYLVVDRRDEKLFAALRGPQTHLVVKQDILPWWLHQIPFRPKWWVSLKGLPVRGWIIQQIVKLSVDAIAPADACIFIDSDTILTTSFDPGKAERDGRVPMFREILPDEIPYNTRWHAAAGRLLGLPAPRSCRTSYVTLPLTWLRANVIKLQRHIEQTTGRGWVESLCGLDTMSECVLYGRFCEEILGDASGHYFHDTVQMLSYWGTKPLDERGLRTLRDGLRSEHLCAMVNARSNTPVRAIRRAFDLEA
jgi:hypothetical protein